MWVAKLVEADELQHRHAVAVLLRELTEAAAHTRGLAGETTFDLRQAMRAQAASARGNQPGRGFSQHRTAQKAHGKGESLLGMWGHGSLYAADEVVAESE